FHPLRGTPVAHLGGGSQNSSPKSVGDCSRSPHDRGSAVDGTAPRRRGRGAKNRRERSARLRRGEGYAGSGRIASGYSERPMVRGDFGNEIPGRFATARCQIAGSENFDLSGRRQGREAAPRALFERRSRTGRESG